MRGIEREGKGGEAGRGGRKRGRRRKRWREEEERNRERNSERVRDGWGSCLTGQTIK